MSASASATLIDVFPSTTLVTIIELPGDYPRLPMNSIDLQPVAYTQGMGFMTYVTILLPLRKQLVPWPPSQIIKDEQNGSITFTYSIPLSTDTNIEESDRLALMNFSFITGLASNVSFKVAIDVFLAEPNNSDTLGKVVMDSNMLPSL